MIRIQSLLSVKKFIWKILFLEHNLFKNVSKWPAFLWQAQIQTIEYGLLWYNTDLWRYINYSFTSSFSDMNFQMILIPKGIVAKMLSEKLVPWNHSYLRYTLAIPKMQKSIKNQKSTCSSHLFTYIYLYEYWHRHASTLTCLVNTLAKIVSSITDSHDFRVQFPFLGKLQLKPKCSFLLLQLQFP